MVSTKQGLIDKEVVDKYKDAHFEAISKQNQVEFGDAEDNSSQTPIINQVSPN